MPNLDLDYAALAAESRAQQGLSPGIEDPDVLAEVRRICAANLLRRSRAAEDADAARSPSDSAGR